MLLGIVDIVVDGVTLLAGEDATLETGGYARTVRKGSKVHGFSRSIMESKLEVTVSIDAGFSVDFYRNIENATVNFKADTGQTWSIQGAWVSTPPTINQKDGSAKITFEGPPAEEIL
jgi:hypothetical protein